jgi:hypothetical protein
MIHKTAKQAQVTGITSFGSSHLLVLAGEGEAWLVVDCEVAVVDVVGVLAARDDVEDGAGTASYFCSEYN